MMQDFIEPVDELEQGRQMQASAGQRLADGPINGRLDWSDLHALLQEKLRQLYITGQFPLDKLASRYGVQLPSLQRVALAEDWTVRRHNYRTGKRKREAQQERVKFKGAAMVGEQIVQAQKESLSRGQSDRVKALEEKNAKVSRMLDLALEKLALSMGIHEQDIALNEQEPGRLVREAKQLMEDRERNTHFIRLLGEFKETVKLQRVIDGQATSITGRAPEGEVDEDEQELLEIQPLTRMLEPQEAAGTPDDAVGPDAEPGGIDDLL